MDIIFVVEIKTDLVLIRAMLRMSSLNKCIELESIIKTSWNSLFARVVLDLAGYGLQYMEWRVRFLSRSHHNILFTFEIAWVRIPQLATPKSANTRWVRFPHTRICSCRIHKPSANSCILCRFGRRVKYAWESWYIHSKLRLTEIQGIILAQGGC